jgi:hypothetical protein
MTTKTTSEMRAELEKAIVRLRILEGRMRACNAHDVSLQEIPSWIEEFHAALATPSVASPQGEQLRLLEAMRWACKDAITGNQIESHVFKRVFPNGILDALTANKILCEPLDEIDKITLESLHKDGYFDIADEELTKAAAPVGEPGRTPQCPHGPFVDAADEQQHKFHCEAYLASVAAPPTQGAPGTREALRTQLERFRNVLRSESNPRIEVAKVLKAIDAILAQSGAPTK